MKDISFTIQGKPISTNSCYRARVIKTKNSGASMPVVYMTKEGKEYKRKAQEIIKQNCSGEPTDKDLVAYIRLNFKDKRRRDIDNYNKILLDSMTGLIYIDDKQIQELHLYKKYGCENDSIDVTIMKYEEE